jgi:hypothetical protein
MGTSGSGHTFSEIFLHLNWHCLKDRPLITASIEPSLQGFIEEYCAKIKGIQLKGVGGREYPIPSPPRVGCLGRGISAGPRTG